MTYDNSIGSRPIRGVTPEGRAACHSLSTRIVAVRADRGLLEEDRPGGAERLQPNPFRIHGSSGVRGTYRGSPGGEIHIGIQTARARGRGKRIDMERRTVRPPA